jgi:OTU domain-containing protein 3
MENNPNKYQEFRQTIVTFMEKNRDMFEPFLDEDDGTFEEYIASMRENGTWGGNLEIQAASLSLRINVIIYQLDQPRWEVVNFADAKTKTIQLSYVTRASESESESE